MGRILQNFALFLLEFHSKVRENTNMSYPKQLEALLMQNLTRFAGITSNENHLKALRECILFNCVETLNYACIFQQTISLNYLCTCFKSKTLQKRDCSVDFGLLTWLLAAIIFNKRFRMFLDMLLSSRLGCNWRLHECPDLFKLASCMTVNLIG